MCFVPVFVCMLALLLSWRLQQRRAMWKKLACQQDKCDRWMCLALSLILVRG